MAGNNQIVGAIQISRITAGVKCQGFVNYLKVILGYQEEEYKHPGYAVCHVHVTLHNNSCFVQYAGSYPNHFDCNKPINKLFS